jgi:DNA topoisomerase I
MAPVVLSAMLTPAGIPLAQLENPVVSAQVVGLNYVSDQLPGIRRERSGKAFRYRHLTGKLVQEPDVLKRIKALAIPPAWEEVWICPDPNGHLQTTGRDDRGRKQYRYHPRWREIRDQTKYTRMVAFGKALPELRRQIQKDLAAPGLSRRKVLATVARLLEVSLIRVGNEEYCRENETFGLTTMKDRHVEVKGSALRFEFRGKGDKWHRVEIEDPRLARIIRKCQELPGQELFQYYDDQGERHNIKSTDVNEYLQEISGQDFTAKDFRTWAGTVLAAMALGELAPGGSAAQAKRNIVQAVERAAERLGNTPAICRKCYIHPGVIEAYQEGTLARTMRRYLREARTNSARELGPEEAAVLGLLEKRLLNEQLGPEVNLRRNLRRSLRRASSLRHKA